MATPTIKEQDPVVLALLPLDDLTHEISRCMYSYTNGGASQGRKSFFKRLVMLEQIRERIYGVPAKQRAFRAR